MNWLLARLKEPSTWRGIIWLLTAFGVTLRPEVWEQIAAVGMALAGLVGVLTSEKSQAVRVELPPIELVGRAGWNEASGGRQPAVSETGSETGDSRQPAVSETGSETGDLRPPLARVPAAPAVDGVRDCGLPTERRSESGPTDGNPPAGWNG